MIKKYFYPLIMLAILVVLSGCGNTSGQESTPDAADTSVDMMSGDDDDYPISEESLDMNGYLVTINTEGLGQVARAEVGRKFAFDEEYPAQSTADHLAEGTKLLIGAKADDGWKFVKWTLNGADYSTDEQFEYTVTEDAEFVAVFDFYDAFETETIDLSTASEILPAYVYQGDEKTAAICDYLTTDIASNYSEAEVSIPYMQIVDTDDSNPDDTLVWGDFRVMNYNLEGDILTTESGGNHPGLMHLKKNSDGSYVVTEFEQVTDGEGFVESAKEIFGDRYDAFSKVQADADAFEEIRKESIKEYVLQNGLSITAYQDYGWDPVSLT